MEIHISEFRNHLYTNAHINMTFESFGSLSNIPFDGEKFKRTVDSIGNYIHDLNEMIIVGAVYPEILCMHYMEDMLMM